MVGGDVGQVALVLLELERVDLQHVRADLVEHLDVVRHHDRRHVGERAQVVHHPLDVARVEVVGRLVEQQDVGLHEHRARQRELHAPTARQAAHLLGQRGGGHLLIVNGEADREQLLLGHLLGDAVLLQAGVLDDEVEHRELREQHARAVGAFALHVRLDKHRAQLRGGREALDLLVGDGAHQGGLARVVAPAEAVAVATLELELRLVEQHLVAVRERELAVAQLLGVVSLLLGLLDVNVDRALVQEGLGEGLGVLELNDGGVRREGGVPLGDVEDLHVEKRVRHARNVAEHVRVGALARALSRVGEHLLALDALPDRVLLGGALELVVSLLRDIARLGV